MSIQADYSEPIRPTYLGTLRGYRNFSTYTKSTYEPGVSSPLGSLSAIHQFPKLGMDEWWTASCRGDKAEFLGGWSAQKTIKEEHESPHSDCSCGYYMNYFPHQTFSVFKYGVRPRAVVECSGRIILGTKGFRTQHMRLIALSFE